MCVCVFRAGVRLGEHNVNTEKDCDPLTRICAPPVLDFYIEDIIVHQQYDPKKLSNDIALLRLATTVNTSFGKFHHLLWYCLCTAHTADIFREHNRYKVFFL